ncbi:hypothetical protein DVK85_12460 [Flavobacterium arcticum]|uniref:Endonuclease GajA/Old nuclease/RecF-like AAA domain-containing protein n=1 Tax=Flavobacterium arcticum TaxID=1784713 RepID=A0A345HEI8_9FLAO|nr:AAA family ATPase [Flavobacterium arcticum]AXG74998.1 hypothetical protein DVK85_12460 [Flavobacterium arcticum]KAF2506551.1 AAA family ATPase [Flavobacterium arcticum]
MEKTKHIKNITIENFKCFNHFSTGEFGLYNIILGNNNAGKTSFLESLLFEENISQTIQHFQALLQFKNIINSSSVFFSNPFHFFINRYTKKESINISMNYYNTSKFIASFKTIKANDIPVEERNSLLKHFNGLTMTDELLKVNLGNKKEVYRKFDTVQNYEKTIDFVNYVYSSSYYSNDLIGFYLDNFANSKEKREELMSNIRFIIPNIQDIEITINSINKEPLIGIWLLDKDEMLSLPMFGDGTIRLFRIVLEIVICKGKYICIDEIDTGIHYTKYKDFIRTIFRVAKNNKVQLFISTHNNEFLKSIKEVLEEKDYSEHQNDTKSFTLKRLPDESIKAYRYNFEEFEFAIEQENELR